MCVCVYLSVNDIFDCDLVKCYFASGFSVDLGYFRHDGGAPRSDPKFRGSSGFRLYSLELS